MEMAHCVGCDDYYPIADIRTYHAVFSSGEEEDVDYCGECAHLATTNWNGVTESIKLVHQNFPKGVPSV